MEMVFLVPKENLEEVKNIIGNGKDSFEKQNIMVRDGESLGLENKRVYVFIDGSKKACELAKKELKNLAEELDEEEKEAAMKKYLENLSEKLNKEINPDEVFTKEVQVLFSADKSKLDEISNILGIGLNSINKQSITLRDNRSLGIEKEGNYLIIVCSEEACKIARKRLKNLTEELKDEKKQEVLRKIKEMEDSALESFGGIFK